MKRSLTIAVCVLNSGCVAESRPRSAVSGTAIKRTPPSELKKQILPGMDIDAAEALLKAEGYTCRRNENATLKYKELNADGKRVEGELENVDFLRCSKSSTSGWVTTIDVIDVVFEGDKVSDVKDFSEFVGP